MGKHFEEIKEFNLKNLIIKILLIILSIILLSIFKLSFNSLKFDLSLTKEIKKKYQNILPIQKKTKLLQ
jgi:hypothetical protein